MIQEALSYHCTSLNSQRPNISSWGGFSNHGVHVQWGGKKIEIESTYEAIDCISMSVGTLQKPVNETSVTKKTQKEPKKDP